MAHGYQLPTHARRRDPNKPRPPAARRQTPECGKLLRYTPRPTLSRTTPPPTPRSADSPAPPPPNSPPATRFAAVDRCSLLVVPPPETATSLPSLPWSVTSHPLPVLPPLQKSQSSSSNFL